MTRIWPIIALALAALGLAIILTGCATRPTFTEWTSDGGLKVIAGERAYINEQAKAHNVQDSYLGCNGFYAAFEGTIYVIYDSYWGSSTMPRLETLGHEFGHTLYGEEFYR